MILVSAAIFLLDPHHMVSKFDSVLGLTTFVVLFVWVQYLILAKFPQQASKNVPKDWAVLLVV
jgi:hypothetical protein